MVFSLGNRYVGHAMRHYLRQGRTSRPGRQERPLDRLSLQRPDSSGDRSALSESRKFFFNQGAHRFHSSGVAVPSIMRSKNATGGVPTQTSLTCCLSKAKILVLIAECRLKTSSPPLTGKGSRCRRRNPAARVRVVPQIHTARHSERWSVRTYQSQRGARPYNQSAEV